MTSLGFALYLTCLCLWGAAQITTLELSVRQESGFQSANVGDSVTLRCFYRGDITAMFYWYKQTLGQKPMLISSFYKHDENGNFFNDLKNDPRFTLETKNGKYHLKISDLRLSDSATYYCLGGNTYEFEFAEGTTVDVKGSDFPVLVHQSSSETIQPGGSVTLNCTVHTGTCDGEHSVYWFKSSEYSHQGLIYTHGGRNDQCERKSNTDTQSCVYNLPMKSLDPSHAGTYYCAVASCGHILFGNGTELNFEDADEVDSNDSLVYALSGALAFTTLLIVLLAFLIYKMNKRNRQCTEHQRASASTTANTEEYQDAGSLHYTALSDLRANRSRKQKANADSECVYSSVKQ